MIYAVVCEFNPFHNGHQFLLSSIPKKPGDYTVCIMSGAFVQRGEPAAFDKWSRAEAAIRNGADLVLELPVPYVLSDGNRFSAMGVRLAAALGAPVTMVFGTEAEELSGLTRLAALKEQELSAPLREFLAMGLSYGEARQRAMEQLLPRESALLRTPNNLLAYGYIKEARKYNLPAMGIMRSAPHDGAPEGHIASASFIRENPDQFDRFCPTPQGPALDRRAAEVGLLTLLKTRSPEALRQCANIGEGLENRICAALTKASSLQELFELIKTKRYSMAKLRRAIMSCALELPKELPTLPPPYLRVLALSTEGRTLLRELKPLIPIAMSGKECERIAPVLFAAERRATDLWYSWCEEPAPAGEDYRRGIIRIFE